MRRTGLSCCACAASGQATADPVITLMKSRRRIVLPEAQTVRPTRFAITARICDRRNGVLGVGLRGSNPKPLMSALGGGFNRSTQHLALGPDVIVTNGTTTTGPVLETTQTVPVVFVNVTDPVSGGFVESLSRPGGNATGFASAEYGTSGKWLQLLKQIAPEVKRVAVLRDPSIASGSGQLGAIQAVAPLLEVDINPIDVRDAGEIERGLTALSSSSNTGVIVTASGAALAHRDLIITLAARLKLPAVYWQRAFATSGGLISYGDDAIDQYRRAAGYVDRILKGEKPADLPVQAPTKFETVINLTTAKALGISMPSSLVVSADEVIE